MTIQRVEKLIYGVEDMEVGTQYYRDWGLEEVKSGPERAVFRTRVGQVIELHPAGHPSLPPTPDPAGSTLRTAIWGVGNEAGLKALVAEVSRDRDVREDEGVFSFSDESGNTVGLTVAQTVEAKVDLVPVNVNKIEPRMNDFIDPKTQANPIRIGHVVFAIEMADRKKAVGFYLDRLGFRLSDSTKTGGDFMRCAGSHDHHNLFLISRADRNAFDHASFEVENFDMVMMGGKFMKEAGWKAETAPGRHILGSNYFWYFRNPCGGNTEYFADMDRMNDDWEPRIWDESPGFSIWSLDDTAMA
ncbi:MAG: VOC family protein [Alphaproteobacteria bacterium]|nr:VOC family protein [Alphaproteobacteria bacterium]